jgi:sodium/potassium-transporting ATPase subunit alpha
VNHREPFEPQLLPVDELFHRLASSRDGHSSAEAEERLAHEGSNSLAAAKPPPLFLRFAKLLRERFALLLWAGGLLALIGEAFSPGEGMLLIAIALAAVVLINSAFSFWQELRVEQAMAAFRKMLSPRARVLRDGLAIDLDAARLVVGDVILLSEGDRVPADARVFEANSLKVDNSLLTGECEPQLRSTEVTTVARTESRNLVFCGTMVTTGNGKAVVYATGIATEIGQIARVTHETERIESPIRRELRHFIRVITRIALVLGGTFFVAGWAIGNPLWTNLVFAIGIIVANVPEGLLPTVTLGLAISGRRMARRHALLKTLESAETLGCTSVICTDKTGTLTCNEMRVTDVLPHDDAAAACVMALCNNATLVRGSNGARAAGDPTETALLLHLESRGSGIVAELRGEHPRLFERPFDSATREMATVHRFPDGAVALLKGAPEVVLGQCTPTTGWLERADQLARSGKRVLALARKHVDPTADMESQVLADGYEFVALVAMHDPPRPEVADAVKRCHDAGIRIIVVTGDHPLTAEAIARQVGIIRGEAKVCTGADIARLGKAALRQMLSRPGVVLARTSPLDKLHVVTALQETGEIVAVTGDGVNDAPALKRADIGVAMGLSGTDVAREAADMVLMDDNFATIVAAIEEGRVIFGNIRRFIGYVLTSNVPEILPYIAFVLLDVPLPLPVLLILAIDLGTDMIPAIGLATEPAETDVMNQPPRPRDERLLSRELLLKSYLLWGLFESAAGFAAYLAVLYHGGWRWGEVLPPGSELHARSIAAFFAAIILCQAANVMIWRTSHQSVFAKGLLRNRAVLAGIAVELAMLWAIVETDFGQRIFATASLPPWAWLIPLPFGVAMLALAEALKWNTRRRCQREDVC